MSCCWCYKSGNYRAELSSNLGVVMFLCRTHALKRNGRHNNNRSPRFHLFCLYFLCLFLSRSSDVETIDSIFLCRTDSSNECCVRNSCAYHSMTFACRFGSSVRLVLRVDRTKQMKCIDQCDGMTKRREMRKRGKQEKYV